MTATVVKGKHILVGVTGSVAAFKTVDLVKRLRLEGAEVSVIMTASAQRFITPLSMQIASAGTVYTDPFEHPLTHISLPAGADLFVVAPASANIIGKYAGAVADDMLSTSLLAFRGTVIMAPAMNWRMYENPILQNRLDLLKSYGVRTVGPERGSLACGEEGIGRMAGIDRIMESVCTAFAEQDLAGEHVLVTAGPTREHLDPVRYITNRSSGKMGCAIARLARRRGAAVTLVSGPTALEAPCDIQTVTVESALEMEKAVMEHIGSASILIMAAAVADYRPAVRNSGKGEKSERLTLELVKNPDILAEISKLKPRPYVVGFAAETGPRLDRARKKLTAKGADMIVFNDVSADKAGFDTDTNIVTLIDATGERPLHLMSKEDVAAAILDRVVAARRTERP